LSAKRVEPSGKSSSKSFNTLTSASEPATKENSTGSPAPVVTLNAPAQTVEVAPFAGDVATKRSSVLFRGIKPAAADTDVVAHRYGQGVHHVCLLRVVGRLLEELGQQRKESPPRRRLDGVQATVEVALAYHGGHVAVFVEEAASLVDVAPEEKVVATKGTLITSAVVSRSWGSSRWSMAFRNSSHNKQ
jgi:hypothetical protein